MDQVTSGMQATNSYDEVPYIGNPFSSTHPDHLSVLGTIYGLTPARVKNARILELGCGDGGNIIPLAYAYPTAKITGIDFASTQIAAAQKTVKEMKLKNIKFECKSILDLETKNIEFDYVICHGVYSWVGPDIQAKILEVCRKVLAKNGLAYISYN